MSKVYELRVNHDVHWGGSVGATMEKAAKDLQVHIMERTVAACVRKYGSDYLSRVTFLSGENSRIIADSETKEEVIRFSDIQSNGYEDIKKRNKVRLSTMYTTWDGKQ